MDYGLTHKNHSIFVGYKLQKRAGVNEDVQKGNIQNPIMHLFGQVFILCVLKYISLTNLAIFLV